MQRLNFTLDKETVALLSELAQKFYHGNKSLTIRAALQSLATHTGHVGWVINGYTPIELSGATSYRTCGTRYRKGDLLYRPVFERGYSHKAVADLSTKTWLDCPGCVTQNIEEVPAAL
tara:strand:- start:1203 stop:1556 length:354 start_codon:yes stop_codon:yes gene_type:complete